MKYLSLLLILFPLSSFADSLNCYSHGNLIYRGEGKELSYDLGIFSLVESKTNKIILVYGDCVAKIDA